MYPVESSVQCFAQTLGTRAIDKDKSEVTSIDHQLHSIKLMNVQ